MKEIPSPCRFYYVITGSVLLTPTPESGIKEVILDSGADDADSQAVEWIWSEFFSSRFSLVFLGGWEENQLFGKHTMLMVQKSSS